MVSIVTVSIGSSFRSFEWVAGERKSGGLMGVSGARCP